MGRRTHRLLPPHGRLAHAAALIVLGWLAGVGAYAQDTEAPPALQAPAATKASWGTGFVVAPGYMLTAHHVVRAHTRHMVGPLEPAGAGRPRWVAAELLKADPARDLALFKVPEHLPALGISDQNQVPPGLEATVIGFPQPRVQGASRKIAQGIVTGHRINAGVPTQTDFLQISAEVFQGNSGGPVLAGDGTVIGMVQRKVIHNRSADRTAEPAQALSLALASSLLLEFLADTPAKPRIQPVDLDRVLRPYQLYEQTQAGVLAVFSFTPGAVRAPLPLPPPAAD